VSTAPAGSVIVIDEFENSLGINCMPELTDFILDKAIERQFILTSHHPYIIHNIPWNKWQIVSRHDSDVKVTYAPDIPELDTASSLDKFTQLINLPEYEGGIL
jgi:predicted ATPase